MADQRILVVEKDAALRRLLRQEVEAGGYVADGAADPKQALKTLAELPIALAIVSLDPGNAAEVEDLARILAENPGTAIILLCEPSLTGTAVSAVVLGAYACLTKPIQSNVLHLAVNRALEHHQLRHEVRDLRSALDRKYGFENIIGRSDALIHVVDTAARAAQLDAPVFMRGESGTGKDLLATAIHFNSRRKHGPFVSFDCIAAGAQAETELFGARSKRAQSRFDQAQGGTLFLNEISELPMQVQTRLLEALQDRQRSVRRKPDVRIIAATRRNVQARVEDGTFREDLYYKLAVIPIELPPLRERAEDIPALVRHFFAISKEKHGRADIVLPDSLLSFFWTYRWPGNVSEVEQVIDRIVAFSRSDQVTAADLPASLRRERTEADVFHLDLPVDGISLEAVEKSLILRALKKFNWNQSRAAKYLDLSRKTLIYRMEKFGLRNLSTKEERNGGQTMLLPSRNIGTV